MDTIVHRRLGTSPDRSSSSSTQSASSQLASCSSGAAAASAIAASRRTRPASTSWTPVELAYRRARQSRTPGSIALLDLEREGAPASTTRPLVRSSGSPSPTRTRRRHDALLAANRRNGSHRSSRSRNLPGAPRRWSPNGVDRAREAASARRATARRGRAATTVSAHSRHWSTTRPSTRPSTRSRESLVERGYLLDDERQSSGFGWARVGLGSARRCSVPPGSSPALAADRPGRLPRHRPRRHRVVRLLRGASRPRHVGSRSNLRRRPPRNGRPRSNKRSSIDASTPPDQRGPHRPGRARRRRPVGDVLAVRGRPRGPLADTHGGGGWFGDGCGGAAAVGAADALMMPASTAARTRDGVATGGRRTWHSVVTTSDSST